MPEDAEFKAKEKRVADFIVSGHSVSQIEKSTGFSQRNIRRIRALPHVQANIRDRLQAMADRAYMRSLEEVNTAFDKLRDLATKKAEESSAIQLQAASTLARLAITSAAALKKDAPPVAEPVKDRVVRIELVEPSNDPREVGDAGPDDGDGLPAAPSSDE